MPERVTRRVEGLLTVARQAKVIVDAGLLRPEWPLTTARVASGIIRWGFTPAAGYTTGAARYADQAAIIDDAGVLTFEEVDLRTNAIARGLAAGGVKPGSAVAVMCRNHRGFIEATVALSKIGADALFLNTGFASPQLAEVAAREEVRAIIHDAEFTSLLSAALRGRTSFLGWGDGGGRVRNRLDDLAAAHDTSNLAPPPSAGRVTILTSGTTGTPKGARRSQPKGLGGAAAILSKIPYRARDRMLIATPLFHSWGLANWELGLLLSCTVVLQRRFDPEATLAAIERERPTLLALVPVMAQRILELPRRTLDRYDTSSLRIAAFSGSALPGDLALRFMDRFGDIAYNLYGSTEVAYATIATPRELRSAPGTAGRAPLGTVVRLVDEQGSEVATGETGRIFVGNDMLFEGYTGGGSKTRMGSLMSTGDVGRFDLKGLLFVDGRDDEMIVSGGENVFPREVEDLLATHPAVSEVAVVGVDDAEFGQRLKAFVVRQGGRRVSEAVLKKLVRDNLARYKVPRDIEFIDALPRNATGKVLKRDLH
ncbi:MAG: AMP-binding protein [Candidatus Dormibacteria bacterium]